jgi:DNA-binding CsgD family transcriptional regulator
MMCDERLYLKSEYYNEFVKPMDLEQALGATLLREGSHTYNLTMFRTYRQAAFDRHELRLLAAVVPHLARAAALFEEFAAIRGAADTFREVLHQLTDGVIVVDRHGRVLEANHAAAEMLRAGNGLRSTPQGIGAVLPDESRGLRAAIAAATHPGGALSIESGDSLVVSRPDGLPPLSVVVTPLRQNMGVGERRVACLFVRDARRTLVRTEWLRAAYGLTAAESHVAALLVLGLSTAQLAARTKVSKETIRTHIKRILAKTGTRQRSELVSLALAGSVPVSR